MRLFDRLTGRQDAARALPTQDVMTLLQQTWGGSDDYERIQATFASFATEGYASNGVIFSLVLKRLELFSQAEFKLQNITARRLYGTPALALLESPWPGGTTSDLLARMEQDASLGGNSFLWRAEPDRLVRLRPDYVTIAALERNGPNGECWHEVAGYFYEEDGPGHGDPVFLPVDEVAHYAPIPDPMASWRGMSWLTPVIRDVNADLAMTQHRQRFFEKAATPNLAVKYPIRLDADRVARLTARFDAGYAGPSNAGKTLLLDEGADLTVVGSSFKDMAFDVVQAAGENRIASAAGVPPIVAGLKEGLNAATYSNYEQALKAFANGTIAYLWQSAVSALGKLVDVPTDSRLWYDTGNIPALQDAETARAEAARTWAVAAGELIRAGYDPQTVANALIAGDMSLLTHTGAVPTALYPDGKAPGPGGTA